MKKFISMSMFLLLLISCGDQGDSYDIKNLNAWPNGNILYKIDEKVSSELKSKIISCFNAIEDKTKCLSFIESGDDRAITISQTSNNVSWATVGFNKMNIIVLNSNANTHNIYHEIFHAIGLNHEHSRQDRDNYIEIKYENIIKSCRKYFDIKEQLYDIEKLPYDYASVMHYGPYGFSESSKETIVFLDNNYAYLSEPTDIDYEKIKDIYSN